MRETLLSYIACPVCHSTNLAFTSFSTDANECREGEVQCVACRQVYPIRGGILNLLPTPSATIVSEQKGWAEMLGETTDELVETMLALPYLADDIWVTTHKNFDQAMASLDVSGKRVLDVGAGRGWASRWMAQSGADYVVATDILTQRFIGLETADVYLERDSVYFERLLADMDNLPLRERIFDVVFMNATLHHSSEIWKTMKQVARVLVRGGVAVVVSEPVRSLVWPHDLSNCPEIAHGINEHTYTILHYLGATLGAGLIPHLSFPSSIEYRLDRGDAVVGQELGRSYAYLARLWRYRTGRWLARHLLLLPVYAVSNMPLVMMATKA